MATAGKIEKKIKNVECFDIRIMTEDGSNIRSDKEGFPRYSYKNTAPNDTTVSEWIKRRFKKLYCGYNVQVLDGNGNPTDGRTKLKNLRETY